MQSICMCQNQREAVHDDIIWSPPDSGDTEWVRWAGIVHVGIGLHAVLMSIAEAHFKGVESLFTDLVSVLYTSGAIKLSVEFYSGGRHCE